MSTCAYIETENKLSERETKLCRSVCQKRLFLFLQTLNLFANCFKDEYCKPFVRKPSHFSFIYYICMLTFTCTCSTADGAAVFLPLPPLPFSLLQLYFNSTLFLNTVSPLFGRLFSFFSQHSCQIICACLIIETKHSFEYLIDSK